MRPYPILVLFLVAIHCLFVRGQERSFEYQEVSLAQTVDHVTE